MSLMSVICCMFYWTVVVLEEIVFPLQLTLLENQTTYILPVFSMTLVSVDNMAINQPNNYEKK